MGFNLNHLQLWVILFPIIYNLDSSTVFAAQNVTIHNQDPSITYSPPGAWTQSAQSPLDVAGTHMLTQNPNATASFNFTGIAIYFLSPLWPYTVNTAVSLDSGPPTLIDLVDHSHSNTGQGPETVQSQVVWNATGLANTQHNLLISVGAGQPYAIVDTLIYTNATNVSTSSSSSMTPTSTSSIQEPIIASSTANATSLPPSTKSKPVVAIALGSLFGILGLLVILSALLYFLRRRRRPMSEAWTVASTPYTTSRNPSLSADASNKHGNGNGNWTADQLYSNNGYSMTQSDDGKTWYNPRYGAVGMPAPAIPSQPYYNGGYHNINSRQHHPPPPPSMTNRVPNHYEPGYALSTITERSTPQMGSEKTPPLANNTPASYQSELDYFTAQQGSEASYSHSVYRQQQQQQQQQHVPSSLGSASPNTNIQSYPSSRRKPVEYKSGNWI